MYNINSFMNFFEYEKIGLEILQSCKMERKMAKLRKVKNIGFLYIQKSYISSHIYDSINICIHFV